MKVFGIGSVLNVHNESWTCLGFSFSGLTGWSVDLANGNEKVSLSLKEVEELLKI